MSLDNAMRAFIASPRGDRSKMLIPCWALTYNCEADEVRQAWERIMTEHSMKPQNSFDEPEGK